MAPCVPGAKPMPAIYATSPGAIGPVTPVAAFTKPPGLICVAASPETRNAGCMHAGKDGQPGPQGPEPERCITRAVAPVELLRVAIRVLRSGAASAIQY